MRMAHAAMPPACSVGDIDRAERFAPVGTLEFSNPQIALAFAASYQQISRR
jgi:hypothetical protein